MTSDGAKTIEAAAAANQATITSQVAGAFQNLRTAMRNAGYADGAWTLGVQTYASPIPPASGFRYGESGYTRQSVGGCGIWNKDANWARDTVVNTLNNTTRNAVAPLGLPVLNMDEALAGHKLCENTVGLLEERGIATWRSPGAADNTEWVSQIRTTSTLFGPYQLQEDLHPSYWGQKALRNCVRQAYNNGAPRGGTCLHGTGLNANGEPNATLG